MTRDPLFGPLLAFGLGGIYVEILGDVQFRITPLTDRGQPPVDIKAIKDILLRISHLVEEVPESANST